MNTSERVDKLLELTADFWNEWLEIAEHEKHQSDNTEMQRDIHNIQNRLMALQFKERANQK